GAGGVVAAAAELVGAGVVVHADGEDVAVGGGVAGPRPRRAREQGRQDHDPGGAPHAAEPVHETRSSSGLLRGWTAQIVGASTRARGRPIKSSPGWGANGQGKSGKAAPHVFSPGGAVDVSPGGRPLALH